eukprot:TRINITY_DN35636_c0_g1_i1.p1 TRINITY_DN35636_c0_g1~~TRINITY_DN35636_c0_g1_i1.p1  ORF type:complete len:224 (+),score=59.89 TRINITY_DN35636_c0_g1_i1:469-1140(+)
MATATEELDVAGFLRQFAGLLDDICEQNAEHDHVETKFNVRHLRGANLKTFFVRLLNYTQSSPVCFLHMAVAVDRFLERSGFLLTKNNAAALCFEGLVACTKFRDDIFLSNESYGRIAGLSQSRMNELEREFLRGIDFNLFVEEDEILVYVKAVSHHAKCTRMQRIKQSPRCADTPPGLVSPPPAAPQRAPPVSESSDGGTVEYVSLESVVVEDGDEGASVVA